MKGSKLFLIDGTSFCYRAYYAIRSLSNSKGEPTNAIYGFITMMRKLLDEEKPGYAAVCFDRKEPTFRHEKFEGYKAHRKPMPDDLVQQMEPIKQFCRLYGLAVCEKAGFEADDLIGTLARRGEKQKNMQVVIITGDKDAMQLVNERVSILNPHKDNAVLGPAEVRKRLDGIGPEQVTDLMALMGDASDNIPGVPGIGEKTAIRLIKEFGSVENLLEHAGRIHSKTLQASLKENAKVARLSKDLAVIDTRVPLEISWEQLEIKPPHAVDLAEFFKRYEFRTLLKEQLPEGEPQKADRRYSAIEDKPAFEKFLAALEKVHEFSFDTETTSADPMSAALVGMSFCWKPFEAYYLPVSDSQHAGPGLPSEKVLAALKPVLEDEKRKKYGQNIKYDWMVLRRHGVELRGVNFDTMIASYLVNPIRLNHNLDDISLDYLGVRKIPTESLLGKGKDQITMDRVPLEQIRDYAAEDADCVFRLKPVLDEKMHENKLEKLFHEVELPLSRVLGRMEMNGVALDLDLLKELSDQAGRELEVLSRDIYREAGEEFNINSTKQLADILFVKMKLPVIKRTKTGYSTDVGVLEKLALTHELPRRLLEYREKSKLKSTYLDALPALVNSETGRIHTSYNQTTTATGRLSSTDPNLQNIPIKTEAGRRIRKAFVPRPDKKGRRRILSADYSQIELRILAHLSGDKEFVSAFKEDRDIHRHTAALLYGVKEKDVTREMRDVAKTINFSVIYGTTAYGLSQNLNTSVSEADSFIENYFKRYHTVKEYLDGQKEQARRQGFLTTMLGRRSYFPEIHSKNQNLRQFAERAAINAPIQGSAADLIKLAMIRIQSRLDSEKFDSLMIMQVHDELVFDMPERESEKLTALVRGEMENAYPMNVPLKVDIFTGDSWYKN